MSLWSVIADNSSAIYTVCIPGFFIAGGYVAWKTVFASAPARPATPVKPSATALRKPPSALPNTKPKSAALGQPEHQARGEAKTVKVPVAVPAPRDERKIDTARVAAHDDDDAAKDSLFAGLGNDAAKPDDANVLRKAERMEELGFHLQARNQPPIPGHETESNMRAKTEILPAPNSTSASETQTQPAPPAAETPAAKPAVPQPAARTQTQELDDILSRIDKVLSDNPVMAEMTLGSDSNAATKQATTDTTKKKTEPPEVPGQQKLF